MEEVEPAGSLLLDQLALREFSIRTERLECNALECNALELYAPSPHQHNAMWLRVPFNSLPSERGSNLLKRAADLYD